MNSSVARRSSGERGYGLQSTGLKPGFSSMTWSHGRCSGRFSKSASLKTSPYSARYIGQGFRDPSTSPRGSSHPSFVTTNRFSMSSDRFIGSSQCSGHRLKVICPAFQSISGLWRSNQSCPKKMLLDARFVTVNRIFSR